MSARQKAPRSRGRPKGSGDQQRNRLLQAAEELLTDSTTELTLRQVALRADVTPPLAHYYFGNRDGLFAALVHDRAGPRIEQLLAVVQERATQPVAALTRLMQRLSLLAASDGFVGRCLLLPQGKPLRTRLHEALEALVQSAQADGQLRSDLSSAYLSQTLLGMCLLPFLDAAPGTANERAARLTLQHVALLQDGILLRTRPDAGAVRDA
jgi:AcrR family transcriptional regulator